MNEIWTFNYPDLSCRHHIEQIYFVIGQIDLIVVPVESLFSELRSEKL